MKKIISLLILSLVIMIGSLQANNVTPETTIEKKKEIVRKIDRNVMAMELMFKKNETMTKKTLYHRYWVVMMDFRHQLDNETNTDEIERVENEVRNWNGRILQLLNQNTEKLEWELSAIIEVNEIKNVVLR
jgi:hypothetical protein